MLALSLSLSFSVSQSLRLSLSRVTCDLEGPCDRKSTELLHRYMRNVPGSSTCQTTLMKSAGVRAALTTRPGHHAVTDNRNVRLVNLLRELHHG